MAPAAAGTYRWLGEVVQDRDLAEVHCNSRNETVHEQQLQVLRCRDDVSAAIDDRYLVGREPVPAMP